MRNKLLHYDVYTVYEWFVDLLHSFTYVVHSKTKLFPKYLSNYIFQFACCSQMTAMEFLEH